MSRVRRFALAAFVAVLGLVMVGPSGVSAAKKKGKGVPALLTYKAMVHIAGGITLTSQHDDIKNCLPGQRWTLEENTDMDLRGNILIETYKNQQIRTTSAKDPASIENRHRLTSYEESNYCPPDDPIELEKPDCTSFKMTGLASLIPDARRSGPKRVSIGVGRKGGSEQDLSCVWGLPSRATPTGSEIESMSNVWSSIVMPLDIRIGQLRSLGVRKSLIRTIRVGGSCAEPIVYRGKKVPADTTNMNDGDCVVDGDFVVTVKRLNRSTRQGVPLN